MKDARADGARKHDRQLDVFLTYYPGGNPFTEP